MEKLTESYLEKPLFDYSDPKEFERVAKEKERKDAVFAIFVELLVEFIEPFTKKFMGKR